ncbi:glutathione S-transferase family protein [Paraburkholderia sp. J12]|uniref:glutathione S-transferase family protein n=1 Tax=Paraburkholderia sp. J12 TaxID=2805432 RepID=UPI002ABD8190|nr:glutathione S-transferase N-terminal domain-containing protein [Paraburkholderia sp. J12]
MNTYRLYFSPGACSLAVHIALEETGVPFELVAVPIPEGAHLRPEYLEINPKGRVPALAIPGEARVLTELPAIMTLIARHPSRTLNMLPPDPLDEARCNEWIAWLAGWVHGAGFGALWRPGRYAADESLHPAVSAQGKRTIEAAFAQIGRMFADERPYALPYGYSIVDPFLFVLYRWGKLIGLPMDEAYEGWTASARRVLARPAVQRALGREGITFAC